MGSDLHRAAVQHTEAALEGLAQALAIGPVAGGALLTPLTYVGDALRLGIDLPTPIRRWSSAISRETFLAALEALSAEAGSWNLPVGDTATDDAGLAFAVRRRDECDSAVLALRRACMPKRRELLDLAEFAAVETVLHLMDSRMSELLSFSDVLRLLGLRSAMNAAWAAKFPERGETSAVIAEREGSVRVEAPPIAEDWPASILGAPPSDEVVARYASRGALKSYVEGVAVQNEGFAEDLAACIDALVEASEGVCFVARRWRKSAGAPGTRDPLQFAAPAVRRLAASTAPASDAPEITSELGPLDPLDAEARLVVSARSVTVRVVEGQTALRSLELGGQVVTVPTSEHHWEATVSMPAAPIRVRVVAADGREFSEVVRFAATDSSHETE